MQPYVLHKKDTAYQHENIILKMKCGGQSFMICSCVAASLSGQLTIIEGKTNSKVCRGILQGNLRAAVRRPKLSGSWVMLWDNGIEAKLLQKEFRERKSAVLSSVRKNGPKISPEHCATSIRSHQKSLFGVIADKGGLMSY